MQMDVEDAAPPQEKSEFHLTIPPLKLLTSKEKLAFARAAYARNPHDLKLRRRLAGMLLLQDRFDEALAVLDRSSGDYYELFLLATVLLNREQPEDSERAVELCQRALQVSTTPHQMAEMRTHLAKAYHRVGKYEESKRLLQQALAANPQEKDAFKRLFRHYLEVERDPAAALQFVESSIAAGVVHARSLGAWVLALAKLGRLDDARVAEGAGRFLVETEPVPPPDWSSLEEFNTALAEEALNHPDMRFNRYGTASLQTWRLDEPCLQRTRFFPQLQRLIQREVEAYVARLAGIDHPFATAVPQHAALRNWCVITEGEGFETPHVHQNGWLSGVYYIHVQDHIAHGSEPGGCIAFGLPDFLVGEQVSNAYGEKIVRPRSGLMMMFPSHIYHRTFPHHGEGRRICYAFDIIPSGKPVAGSPITASQAVTNVYPEVNDEQSHVGAS